MPSGGWTGSVARARLQFCLAALVAARPALAAITFVQAVPQFDTLLGVPVVSSPFSTNPVVGNRIVVIAWSYADNLSGGTPNLSASDSAGNAYTRHVQGCGGSAPDNACAAILSAPVTSTGSSFRVTVTSAPGLEQLEAVAMEYSGVGPVDRTATATGSSGSPTVSTGSASQSTNELVATSMTLLSGPLVYTSIAPGAGYTVRGLQLDSATYQAGEAADRIVTTTGVQSNTWTVAPNSPSPSWWTCITTFASSNPSAEGPDGGATGADGGGDLDAGGPDAGSIGGAAPGSDDGGNVRSRSALGWSCGCSAGGPPGALVALSAAWAISRRRRRSACSARPSHLKRLLRSRT